MRSVAEKNIEFINYNYNKHKKTSTYNTDNKLCDAHIKYNKKTKKFYLIENHSSECNILSKNNAPKIVINLTNQSHKYSDFKNLLLSK